MKNFGYCLLICLFLIKPATATEIQRAYVAKFLTYIYWRDHLTTTPTPEFLAFIEPKSLLTEALREKWLYQLALSHNWETFHKYYQTSNDLSLQCYDLMATNYLTQQTNFIQNTIPSWLSIESPPSACNALFTLLIKQHAVSNELIIKRIILALERNQQTLAHDLFLQLTPARVDEATLLSQIYRNPKLITKLTITPIHSYFYLYGLKLMIAKNMEQAIKIWSMPISKQHLNETQQQSFITKIALYKAMRNATDTELWFARLKPNDQDNIIIEWQIRYALLHKNWHKVLNLIEHLHDKDTPIWQYWQARAYQALHQKEKATSLYKQIAMKRNYYGFLSSRRLNQPFQFEGTAALDTPNQELLNDYKPILDQVRSLYLSNQQLEASRLLNAFMTELPVQDKIEITYWVDRELHWHGKSVALSMIDELSNHLELRFPLADQEVIQQQAKKYKIPTALVYAIIRQESAFREDIISPAGAYGLMQLMPTTAKNTAKREKIIFTDKQQLFIPQKNIELGVAYLHQLSPLLHAHPVLMAGSYNAGPRQVKSWIASHPTDSLDIWIESLPWIETRNYIKNIIAFYVVYQHRLNQKTELDFMNDLRR